MENSRMRERGEEIEHGEEEESENGDGEERSKMAER